MKIALNEIEQDLKLQPRETLHVDWIEEYATDMLRGAEMPPVVVFYEEASGTYWLADGFHRIAAAAAAKVASIDCDVMLGGRRDALLYSCGANATHGHRRTNGDKQRAVDIMLNDPEWREWSDSQIARQCIVGQPMVSRRRAEIASYSMNKMAEPRPRTVTRGGTTYSMNTGGIGRKPAAPPPRDIPPDHGITIDHEAAHLREKAMNAIRTLASLPEPAEVLAAWMKGTGFGEPYQTLTRASEWLTEFEELYRDAEPKRCRRNKLPMTGETHASV